MQDHDTSGPKDPHTEILKQRSCTNCPTILIQRSRTSGPIRSWYSGPKDPATEILHKCSYRILIQVVQRIIHTEILKQRSCTSGPTGSWYRDLAQVVLEDPDTSGSKASWYEILRKWSYRILIQVVRILIQRSCYKCRADLLSLLVGVRSHTLFGVSCRDNLVTWTVSCKSELHVGDLKTLYRKAKCIVFCQWDSLLGNIARAFKDFGVRYSRLRGSVYAQTRTLVNFQGDRAARGKEGLLERLRWIEQTKGLQTASWSRFRMFWCFFSACWMV